MTLLVRDEARADMREAVAWYEARDTGLGDRFLIEIERVFARIERQPHGFPSGYAGLRKALCRRFPYSVYFAFDGSN